MKIFPYILVRFGGISIDEWKRINYDDINNMLGNIQALKEKLEFQKEKLCDDLFKFIKNAKDPKHQNTVLNLRRDIFNHRRLKLSKIRIAGEMLPDSLKQALTKYLNGIKTLEELVENGSNIYSKSLVKAREEFKLLVANQYLSKGMVLSSHTLLNRIESYIDKEVKSFKPKEIRIEQSLIKYITRMCAKTSPFSTFASLSIAELSSITDAVSPLFLESKTGKNKIVGYVRLNNSLMKYLLNLIKKYNKAYRHLNLRANPTIKKKDSAFLYLTNSNNIESFQHIPYDQVLDLVLGIIKKDSEGITFENLMAHLGTQIEASAQELEDYINQLIDFGFLEYNIGISGIDPYWDIKLVEKLSLLEEEGVPHIKQLISTLKSIRNLGEKYGLANVVRRKQIVVKAFTMFRNVAMEIHQEAGLPLDEFKTSEERQKEWLQKVKGLNKEKQHDPDIHRKKNDGKNLKQTEFKHQFSTAFNFKPEQIFYEDTTSKTTMKIDNDALSKLIGSLNNLLQELKPFRGMEEEKIKMTHFFKKKYKTRKIPLITFYEDYFREFKKPENEWMQNKNKQENNDRPIDKNTLFKNNPYHIEPIKERQTLIDDWNDQYKKVIGHAVSPESDEVHIGLDEIKKVNSMMNIDIEPTKNCSYGSFIQLYLDQYGHLNGVINSSFSGFGKMMSRFLHIFDNKVTEALKAWNNNTNQEGELFIENCDASYFNANVHPPLMPYEVWIPGGQNRLPTKKQLPITEFEVSLDDQSNELKLLHKISGKRAYIFDLGFQGHKGRSQLFQLLEKFTKAEYLFTSPIANAINQVYESKTRNDPAIVVHPRIVYNRQIILQRKCWYVSKEKIPIRFTLESEWEYFIKINEWRKKLFIQTEVFIFINPDRRNTNLDPNLTKRLTRDDYKPQYIDFANPLLVALFEKSVVKIPKFLKIEEMLPNSNKMLKERNQSLVSECVIQWYC